MGSLSQLLESGIAPKSSHRQYVNEWMCLISNKTLFTRAGSGQDSAQTCSLQTPELEPWTVISMCECSKKILFLAPSPTEACQQCLVRLLGCIQTQKKGCCVIMNAATFGWLYPLHVMLTSQVKSQEVPFTNMYCSESGSPMHSGTLIIWKGYVMGK